MSYIDAVAEVTEEFLAVWKHHIGLRVIQGPEFEGER